MGSKNFSIKEERELNLIEAGLEHKGDHFVATYPWEKDPNLLPNNKMIAHKMLENTERRLIKHPEYGKMYCDQIQDMIKRNVARKLSEEELKAYRGPKFYPSHHAVLKLESKSSPCRIVFNSSARMYGHVINDYWAKGPNLLNNLLGVLVRFREGKFAMTGDIRKMYHAIKLSEVDQHTHRFLWRELDVTRSPDTYIMTSVSFGDKPAGNIAISALKKTAEMGKHEYPIASKVVINNIYVDDIITSFDSRKRCMKIACDIDNLLKPGAFEVKEWIISQDKKSDKQLSYCSKEKPLYSSKECKVLGLL